MMNVILTGSSGFVGQNLTPFLSNKGGNIFALSLRGAWGTKLPGQYEAIIHLAGKAHDTRNTSNPEEYFQVNTELTRKLFDRFLQGRSEEHTSELQSLMRISYAVFCLKKKKRSTNK